MFDRLFNRQKAEEPDIMPVQIQRQIQFAETELVIEKSKQAILRSFKNMLERSYIDPEEADDYLRAIEESFEKFSQGLIQYGAFTERYEKLMEDYRNSLKK